MASGQGAANYTSIIMRPTVTATISGVTVTGRGVLEFDGADNITINGDIAGGPVNKDLTIECATANTITATAAIRLIGRATLGLGATNYTISNCNIIGSTPGNDGSSGSTINNSYGTYAGSTTLALASGGTGDNYDNIVIDNNNFSRAYLVYILAELCRASDNAVISNNTFGSSVRR